MLAAPHVLVPQLPCSRVPGGHRIRTCLDCGTINYEPPHDTEQAGRGDGSYDEVR
jgi:hypothetical protein